MQKFIYTFKHGLKLKFWLKFFCVLCLVYDYHLWVASRRLGTRSVFRARFRLFLQLFNILLKILGYLQYWLQLFPTTQKMSFKGEFQLATTKQLYNFSEQLKYYSFLCSLGVIQDGCQIIPPYFQYMKDLNQPVVLRDVENIVRYIKTLA